MSDLLKTALLVVIAFPALAASHHPDTKMAKWLKLSAVDQFDTAQTFVSKLHALDALPATKSRAPAQIARELVLCAKNQADGRDTFNKEATIGYYLAICVEPYMTP